MCPEDCVLGTQRGNCCSTERKLSARPRSFVDNSVHARAHSLARFLDRRAFALVIAANACPDVSGLRLAAEDAGCPAALDDGVAGFFSAGELERSGSFTATFSLDYGEGNRTVIDRIDPMADLRPSPFCDLVKRMFLEPEKQQTIFDLPLRKMYVPDPMLDTSVRFHGQKAATPVGPSAGPQTQMAQNILLSWLGGSRILELKTVQINDQLVINRPCIDMTNVGYNIEFSQELRLHESIHEYVAGMMLIEMLKASNLLGFQPSRFDKTSTIYDFSLGYDLAGISSKPIRDFIASLRHAEKHIDKLRMEIPDRWKQYRDLPYPNEISRTVTLSTFHNCPPNEIEKICHFLLTEIGMHVTVKMNPMMLGGEELNYLLQDRLGFKDIQVNQKAIEAGLKFDEGIEMMRRLSATAKKLGLGFATKFSNTLEVTNHRAFFPKAAVMDLSGLPLHVITLRLVQRWRERFGLDCPISFSAGVDKHNFTNCVACGFVPITTSSDLLKVGGYGRLFE